MRRLRGDDLEKPFHGVRRRKGGRHDLRSHCLDLAARLPSYAFFFGPTAARLQGVPLPSSLERSRILHVAVPPPHRALRVAGVDSRTLDVPSGELRDWLDLPVTPPARTWRDLAAHLSLWNLVAAGDAILHGPALATREQLEEEVRKATGGRYVRLLRAALPLLDERAESRRESHVRMALIEGGVTGFQPNHRVQLTNPRVRYRIDIAFPDAMLGVEYQGEHHLAPDQWRSDLTRRSRLRAHGWAIEEISKDDLADPPELAHRIRSLLAQRS